MASLILLPSVNKSDLRFVEPRPLPYIREESPGFALTVKRHFTFVKSVGP